MYFALLIVLLVIGVGLFFFMRAPKLSPKKNIAERALQVSDALHTYRFDIRSLIHDTLSLHTHHDTTTLQTRSSSATRAHTALTQQLDTIDEHLTPYGRVKALRQFHDIATAAAGTLRQVVAQYHELHQDSMAIEPLIQQLQAITTLTQDPLMSTYIDNETEPATLERVSTQYAAIVSHIQNAHSTTQSLQPLTQEFRSVAASLATALSTAEKDYVATAQLLTDRQFDTFHTQALALPYFLQRFNGDSLATVATAALYETPEERFLTDLRPYQYE